MKYYTGSNPPEFPIGKIICLARTYKKHAQEMSSETPKEPIIFLKPTTSIIYTNQAIKIPAQSHSIHHEIELGVIIGENAKNIVEEQANEHIWGYLLALDITARDIQAQLKELRLPWAISKGFDTFAPISDVLPKEKIQDPHNLELKLLVNNQIKQHSNTNQLTHSIPHIISYLSTIMTLEPGDLILTGTPEGVGELKEHDVIHATLGKNLLELDCIVEKVQ